ncbi:MAG: ester cyclase [Acetobacteraceae bacterium]
MSVEENKALIRRYDDAMNSHDVDASAAFFAPDATNHGHPVGREGFRTVFTDIFATFPDLNGTIDELVAEGDVVVSRHTTTATHSGTPIVRNVHNMKGIPPTGKPVIMKSIHIWHIKDGLITSHMAARDDLETMQQIGLWPPPSLRPSEG